MSEASSEAADAPPRRLLFLSSCVRGGGAGWSLYYLLKHLDRTRIEPLVLVPDQGIFREHFAALGIRVIEMPAITERSDQQRFRTVNRLTRVISFIHNILSALSAVPRIVALIRREAISGVHCNNMLVKPIGALAAQAAGVPVALHARNLHERPARIWFYGMIARLPRVRRVIANSAATAAPYRQAVPDKVEVVWNGIDLDEYRPETIPRDEWRRALGLGNDVRIVGFTGHLIPRKGLDTLIRSAALVVQAFPEACFVIAGRVPIGSPVDYLARYQGLARDLGVEHNLRFIGFVPDVRPLLRDFDLLVLPSMQEPFGRSIIEAMAMRTPVIASAVGGIPEILSEGENGLLVEPGDPRPLAEAIGRLLGAPEQAVALSAKARDMVEERFDVRRLTRRIEALLLDL